MVTPQEKQFARKLSKAGWYTYVHDESGRTVTNAYPKELEKLEQISGLPCEVVTPPLTSDTCARIGPKLQNANVSSVP